jgi:hypothetical protein
LTEQAAAERARLQDEITKTLRGIGYLAAIIDLGGMLEIAPDMTARQAFASLSAIARKQGYISK